MSTLQFAIGRVTLPADGSASEVVPIRVGRTELRLFPISGSAFAYGPDNTVTVQTGYPINSVNTLKEALLNVESAIWAAGANSVVGFLEIFSA